MTSIFARCALASVAVLGATFGAGLYAQAADRSQLAAAAGADRRQRCAVAIDDADDTTGDGLAFAIQLDDGGRAGLRFLGKPAAEHGVVRHAGEGPAGAGTPAAAISRAMETMPSAASTASATSPT